MDSTNIQLAKMFAMQAHAEQKRKYTGEPYIKHCAEVAGVLRRFNFGETAIMAGWLHDTIEDTWVTYPHLYEMFGKDVADVVLEVTDLSDEERYRELPRAERKRIDREYFAKASSMGKAVKLADLCSNTVDIVANDRNFARVYLPEALLLLPKLSCAYAASLFEHTNDIVHEAVEDLARQGG